LNAFDKDILLFLNGFVGRWPHLDVALVQFQQNNLLNGAPFLAAIWYLWFYPGPDDNLRMRRKLWTTLCATVAGIVAARLLAHILPFRLRPFVNPELHLLIPDKIPPTGLATWSAFPSDHGLVWFALATGIWWAHRTLGAVALLYASFLGIGRVYWGAHNPTDILAGGAIGIGLVALLSLESLQTALYRPAMRLQQTNLGFFYLCAFVATYEMANMFTEVRTLAQLAGNMLRLL